MERWGVGSVQQAFSGYQALPSDDKEFMWWQILQVTPDAPLNVIKAAYRRLALAHHPDAGGSSSSMAELNRAYEEAQRSRGALTFYTVVDMDDWEYEDCPVCGHLEGVSEGEASPSDTPPKYFVC